MVAVVVEAVAVEEEEVSKRETKDETNMSEGKDKPKNRERAKQI